MSAALPLNELIEKFHEIHGDFYDYSLVDLKNKINGKIRIICPEHGEFLSNHLGHKDGHGCKACGYARNKKSLSKIFIMDLADLENHFKEKFGDLIEFKDALYKNSSSPLDLLCKKHNLRFCNTAYHVIRGAGCEKCRREKIHLAADKKRLGNDRFIERAKAKHGDRYNYSLVNYKSLTDPVQIICQEHGIFLQKPQQHLAGSGCQICAESAISMIGLEWLASLKIKSLEIEYRIEYNHNRYFVDGYDSDTNTVYEFYGDYWHGNPRTTNPDKINLQAGKTFRELYENTLLREANIKSLGYNVVTIWEDEFNEEKNIIISG